MLKIIGGYAKGLSLRTPKGLETRPTRAKVREALMNILQQEIPQAVFIDLFAGTGAVGIEALSRGASACYFAEKKPEILQYNIKIFKESLERQGIAAPHISVFKDSSESALEHLHKQKIKADIIWADPPYEDDLLGVDEVDLLLETLNKDGIIVWERPKNAITNPFPQLQEPRIKSYGKTSLWLWRSV